MNLAPFRLDQWLAAHEFATPPIRFNLASSTGPVWILRELLALGDGAVRQDLDVLALSYVPPEGTHALREAIGEAHGVDPDWVVATTGASEALSVLYCLAAEPGASIALPHPGFPAFAVMARAWGLEVTTYELEREHGFAMSAERVLSAVNKGTRLALVNSPHNPTGAVMPAAELAGLCATLEKRGIPVIVDEVYHPAYFGAAAQSAAQLANTIVVGDFSKAYSLSGLRIGWLIDRDAARRERLINLRSYFTVSGSAVTERLAVHALANRRAILTRLEEVTRTNLALLEEFMRAHRKSIGWVRPCGGTVAFPWRLDGADARPMCEALARAGVLVAPGDCFDAPAHFRVGFGVQTTGFKDALQIAARVIASRSRKSGIKTARLMA
jgi:aspartate/methionine/tyrosine aminotransferase